MPKQIRIESLDVLKAMRQVKEREEARKCEVCWADEKETIIYEFKGSLYCEDDRERAIAEGWHNA